jgi:hypothetical protein
VRETELRAPVLAHLSARGERAWAAPDGHDYFDIVSVGPRGIGLVELKVAAAGRVFAQALRRRAYADWVAIAIPSERAARRLLTLPQAPLANRVGVWEIRKDGTVNEIRPAASMVLADDPFGPARAAFREIVEALLRGELPEGVDWAGNRGPGLPGPGRRTTKDWRLEEFPEA